MAAGYHWPQFSVHRGGLQLLLAATVRRLGAGSVRTGHTVTELDQTDDKVTVTFAHGARLTGRRRRRSAWPTASSGPRSS